MEAIGAAVESAFGGKWVPFATAIGVYVVFVLKLYESTPTVKNSEKAKNLLAGIRLAGGIVVTTAAVILTGYAIFGSINQGIVGMFSALGAVIAVGLTLYIVGRKYPTASGQVPQDGQVQASGQAPASEPTASV